MAKSSIRARQTFDPVSLAVIWSRLVGIAEECWVTLWRTAFSSIIGDTQDIACELLDANGDSLAHSSRSMPAFNLCLPRVVREALRTFHADGELAEGDAIITNDPWMCAGHLPDLALITPVLRNGKLVGFVGSIAHCSDIGGSWDAPKAHEVYEEGLQIPLVKLYDRGRVNDGIVTIIRKNVRNADQVIGDIHAQLSANRVGMNRLHRLMDEYGLDDLVELAAAVQSRAEVAMRNAIADIPDGVYENAVVANALGRRLKLPVQVAVAGDRITVDYQGAPGEIEPGGVNSTLSYTEAHTMYGLKCLLTPRILSNAGCYRPLAVDAPAGSVLNCTYPAPVSIRTYTGWLCEYAVIGALAPALPAKAQAHTGLATAFGSFGRDGGRFFNDTFLMGGGQGSRAGDDGRGALIFPSSARTTSIEVFELRTSLLIDCKELITDSGGAGEFRGGLGERMRLKKLSDDGEPVRFSFIVPQLDVQTEGLFGGFQGQGAAIRLETAAGVTANDDLKGVAELREPGDSLVFETPGGSGFGRATVRDRRALSLDVASGYVSQAAAREMYGWTGSHE
jgi:5-oxoprolinase (ATP-hydrolysing)/N-methylhydantoinase A